MTPCQWFFFKHVAGIIFKMGILYSRNNKISVSAFDLWFQSFAHHHIQFFFSHFTQCAFFCFLGNGWISSGSQLRFCTTFYETFLIITSSELSTKSLQKLIKGGSKTEEALGSGASGIKFREGGQEVNHLIIFQFPQILIKLMEYLKRFM